MRQLPDGWPGPTGSLGLIRLGVRVDERDALEGIYLNNLTLDVVNRVSEISCSERCVTCSEHYSLQPPIFSALCLACGLMNRSPAPHRLGESSVRARLAPESAKHPTRCEKGK